MSPETIDVYNLNNVSHLSAIRCADFSEAAAVCLDFHGHTSERKVLVDGDLKGEFSLIWEETTQKIRNSRSDMTYTIESGAYCLAMLVIERLTQLKVTRQSQKRAGFDYWLGQSEEIGMQNQARLEVSGILQGTKGQINQRLREKIEQTTKSDKLDIPAYVVVVEFSRPFIKVKKR